MLVGMINDIVLLVICETYKSAISFVGNNIYPSFMTLT